MTNFETVLNNISTTLGADYSSGSGSFVLAPGYGAVILSRVTAEGQQPISVSHPLRITISLSDNVYTVFRVVGLSGDVVTGVVSEGADRDYPAGSPVQSRLTSLQFRSVTLAVNAVESGNFDAFFAFTQNTPAALWAITHNLGKYPSVSVVDSGGSVCYGTVTYLSANVLTVSFSAGFAGTAYLN